MARKARPYDLSVLADIARFRRRLNRFFKMPTERKRRAVDIALRHLRGRAEGTITQTRNGMSIVYSEGRTYGQPTDVRLMVGRGMR